MFQKAHRLDFDDEEMLKIYFKEKISLLEGEIKFSIRFPFSSS